MSAKYEAVETLVLLPHGAGGFDVRNCPDPEMLASSIADAMNAQREAADWPAQKEYLTRQTANQRVAATWARNVLKRMRDNLVNIKLGLEKDADQVRFGSTNDADQFRDVVNELERIEEWRIVEKGEPPRDWITETAEANKLVGTLRFALERGQRSEAQLDEEIASLKRRNRDLLDTNNRYLERARAGRAVLRRILKSIEKALDDKVIVDTFWMADVSAETVVDAIEHELDQRISQ